MASQEQSLGNGSQWLLGLERQGLRSSMQIQAQGASVDFRQLGQDVTVTPTKLQLAGNWTYTADKAGSFGVGFARISRYDAVSVSTLSANYSIRIRSRSRRRLGLGLRSAGAFRLTMG